MRHIVHVANPAPLTHPPANHQAAQADTLALASKHLVLT